MSAPTSLNAVVVGADRLGNIPDLLGTHNIRIIHHISGRDPSHQRRALRLPSGTELVILLTDFLGHNVMKSFRQAAQRSGAKVMACRRSVCAMQQALEQSGLCQRVEQDNAMCNGCPRRADHLESRGGRGSNRPRSN